MLGLITKAYIARAHRYAFILYAAVGLYISIIYVTQARLFTLPWLGLVLAGAEVSFFVPDTSADMCGQFGTGANGHFGTSAEIFCVRSVLSQS